jgi:hypothetical protein
MHATVKVNEEEEEEAQSAFDGRPLLYLQGWKGSRGRIDRVSWRGLCRSAAGLNLSTVQYCLCWIMRLLGLIARAVMMTSVGWKTKAFGERPFRVVCLATADCPVSCLCINWVYPVIYDCIAHRSNTR